MKNNRFKLKLSALFVLGLSMPMAHAATSLFAVTVGGSPTDPFAKIITVSAKKDRNYPYVGIKITDPKYIGKIRQIEGCAMNRDGWCVFSVEGNHSHQRKQITLRMNSLLAGAEHIKYPLPMPRAVSSETLKLQIAVNANPSMKDGTFNATSTQEVTASTPGKLIGYIYGSEPPLSTDDIIAAGYTHVLINAAPFDVTTLGTTVLYMNALSGFGTFATGSGQVSSPGADANSNLQTFISDLHAGNVFVLLSIGGTIYGTYPTNITPYFSTAVQNVSSPQDFINGLIGTPTTLNTLSYLEYAYGFDGYDFNIEGGLGTTTATESAVDNFQNPFAGCDLGSYNYGCTSYYLYDLIITIWESVYSSIGNKLLLSIPPQYSQAGANNQYNSIYDTFAALVSYQMPNTSAQLYSYLAWFGPQLYNPGTGGSIYGINGTTYPLSGQTFTSTTDTAVALAVDVMASWPQGTSPYFLPYTAYLNQSQVVMGYAINEGTGDGSPVASDPVVYNTIICLRSGTCCTSYTPTNSAGGSATYPDFAGVFAFTINGDAANNYSFADTLWGCVVQGDCSSTCQ